MKSTSPDAAWQHELIELISFASQDKPTLKKLLEELLSPEELRATALRWQIIKLLKRNIPHRNIAQSLQTSIVTVTRGSRILSKPQNGFHKLFRMIQHTKQPTGLLKAWRKQLTE
ncbi:MAG: Trp family transcriptional regulator [Candidatus Uhrbacteria bacterium]|nr:Trp family transcriptional regulator [Candidatus Uhrbacteria bacterium]